MVILGIGGSDHDVASCIVKDGNIITAIEEERISRHKYALGTNLLLGLSRKYCLKEANISLNEVDEIIVDDILAETAYFGVRNQVKKIRHHLAHAASSYYPSPFMEAAVLVVDNAGSLIEENGEAGLETISYGIGVNKKLELLETIKGENWHEARLGQRKEVYQRGDSDDSLGHLYKIVSGKIGFKFSENNDFFYPEAGKTMGLAPYGDDRYYNEMRKFMSFGPNGRVKLTLSDGKLSKFLDDILESDGKGDLLFGCRANIAHAAQMVLEDALVFCGEYLYSLTKLKKMCYAGGVALNCVANGKLLDKLPFEEIFVFPACGDNGTAIGCALWGAFNIGNLEDKSVSKFTMPYFGRTYSDDEIRSELEKTEGIVWEETQTPAKTAARLISEGKIIGWYQGGCELGPRALGHRSILADSRNPDVKDILNSRVKFREAFRPFAPSILYDKMTDYFSKKVESPYMLLALDVKEEVRDKIPGVVHVDGTARLQTVTREMNGIYAELIEEFDRLTGVPIVVNTSFNVKGEPIVETPFDAIKCLLKTDIDTLVIGNYIVNKEAKK